MKGKTGEAERWGSWNDIFVVPRRSPCCPVQRVVVTPKPLPVPLPAPLRRTILTSTDRRALTERKDVTTVVTEEGDKRAFVICFLCCVLWSLLRISCVCLCKQILLTCQNPRSPFFGTSRRESLNSPSYKTPDLYRMGGLDKSPTYALRLLHSIFLNARSLLSSSPAVCQFTCSSEVIFEKYNSLCPNTQ